MKKAAATRMLILQKAFETIYSKGYHNASVDEILELTHVTKGAFYYHFKNKEEMGLAVISEIMAPGMRDSLIAPLAHSQNAIDDIYRMVKALLFETPGLDPKFGCPAANLVQEMAGIHPEFAKSLEKLTLELQQAIADALQSGKQSGTIKSETDVQNAALYIMSGYWGIRNYAKLSGASESYMPYLQQLKNYLSGL